MKLSATLLILLVSLLLAFPAPVRPHTAEDEVLQGVGVDERPGAVIPPDLAFTDQNGRRVRIGDYFNNGPVLLTLNYYSCPTLCPLIFNNLVRTMAGIRGLSLGRDFRIVTVSIDPEETVERAREKADITYAMLRGVGDPGRSWPFLLGREQEISRLAAGVGIRYLRLEKNNFAHPSVFVVLTPDGRVSRYLYGLELEPRDLKMALIEAAGGRIGGSGALNRILLYCYHYDPVGKKYALAAVNIMKIVGAVVLLLLAALILGLRRREKVAIPPPGKDSRDG
jgi:protein SCO1/2